jgi:putative transposase
MFIEWFNRRLRDECLNLHRFTLIEDAWAKIEAWLVDYNPSAYCLTSLCR